MHVGVARNMNKQITYSELKDGMRVFLCGYLFKVSEVRTEETYCNGSGFQKDPISVVNFIGTCTADKRNNSIRHSIYNNSTYGGRADAQCWINISRSVESE